MRIEITGRERGGERRGLARKTKGRRFHGSADVLCSYVMLGADLGASYAFADALLP